MQLSPSQNFLRAKKDKHHYNVSSEAFSLDNRQFVLYNISLKKDYSDIYDYINYRRGLTYMEEIINFQHSQLTVARKGLRKFRDLMAEYLNLKESHVNNSKYHNEERNRLFKDLQNSNSDAFYIYNTEKVNGQNAQISVVCDKYWLIGSKNKCLLAMNEEDLQKMRNKHEYRQNILIAKAWFAILKNKSEEQIKGIKLQLANKTLIGQYCNMENMQHLVNYGNEAQLFFYSLVQKDNLEEDCICLSATFKFLQAFKLPQVKVQVSECKTFDHMIEKLRQVVVRMNQLTMKEGGQGSVIYISGVKDNLEKNHLICKVKTIEYRIYRKLREKLKIYIQKFSKNSDNLFKKYTKEINEIARDFKLQRPLDHYLDIAKKAFALCEDQNRPVARFISNRFIDFLKLVEKNISKEKFTQIVNSSKWQAQQDQDEEEMMKKQTSQIEEESLTKKQEKQQDNTKRVIMLIPLSIPSSGKSTLLEVIKKHNTNFKIWSVSNDEAKREIMDQMMKKMKNMTRKQAFQKCGKKAMKVFYDRITQTFKNISLSKEKNHVFFIDKNHPQSAVKPLIKNVEQSRIPFKNIKLIKLCLLHESQNRLRQKGLYSYPFSSAYMITCLKRVLNRPEHLTLQGSQEERCNIVFGFSNLFRNFSLSPYNLKKYFDQRVEFALNNEKCIDPEVDKQLISLFKEILLKGKPGNFDDVHPKLDHFIQMLKNWKLVEGSLQESAVSGLKKLQELFNNFENISFEDIQKQQE